MAVIAVGVESRFEGRARRLSDTMCRPKGIAGESIGAQPGRYLWQWLLRLFMQAEKPA